MRDIIQIKVCDPLQQISKWSFYLMLGTFPLGLFLNSLFATTFLIAFGLFCLTTEVLLIKVLTQNNGFTF